MGIAHFHEELSNDMPLSSEQKKELMLNLFEEYPEEVQAVLQHLNPKSIHMAERCYPSYRHVGWWLVQGTSHCEWQCITCNVSTRNGSGHQSWTRRYDCILALAKGLLTTSN